MVSDDLNKRFFETIGRHFVTLSCVQITPGDAKEIALVFSGFLVDIRGAWFYITAGHILRKIRAALEAGATFDAWRLSDHAAGNRFKGIAIPFDFDIDRWLVIEDETQGFDYAAVLLDPPYRRLLTAGNAAPIGRDAWGNPFAEYDQWALVGIPFESVAYDGKTIITARFNLIPVEPAEAPAVAGMKVNNQFYGRLAPDSVTVARDIGGMSGGPIFGTKRADGKLKYWIIGLQSGWYQSTRTITACPFASLGFELERIVDEALAKQRGTLQPRPV